MGKPATNTRGAPKPPPSRLGQVRRGRVVAGTRFLFYGAEGVGKSSLAAHAEEPIVIDAEGSTNWLDVARYPFADGTVPTSYGQVLAAINDLTFHDHGFKTLVIDTLDRLEALIWTHCIARDNARRSAKQKEMHTIEDYGYGKGYIVALDEWRNLARHLDRLRATKGMHVILLGHQVIRVFKNPEGDDFDRYQLACHDKAGGFLKEWADVVGFCCFEEYVDTGLDGKQRAKGASSGRRLMKLQRTAAYDAKTRLALGDKLELDEQNPWGPLADAIDFATNAERIRAAISEQLLRLGDPELTKNVSVAVNQAGDNTATLSRYLGELKKRNPEEEESDV